MIQFISILLTFFLPMFSIIPNILFLTLSKKHKIFFAAMSALSLALIAYVWSPGFTYDLYRHHTEVQSINLPFFEYMAKYNVFSEPLHYMYKFAISMMRDKNLLQFFIVFIGYFEIIFMISDYAKKAKIKNYIFAIALVSMLISLKFIDFTSGLFFNFAIINFAFGFYLEKYNNKKYICWFFYLIAPFIHIASVYLLILYLAAKYIRINKTTLIITTTSLSLFIGPLIILLHSNFASNEFIAVIYKFFLSYIDNGEQYDGLHSGSVLIFAFYRLAICAIFLFIAKKNIEDENTFELMTVLSIIAILPSANVYIRYAFFAQLIVAPYMINLLNSKHGYAVVSLLVPVILYGGYAQISTINNSGIIDDIDKNKNSMIFELLDKDNR